MFSSWRLAEGGLRVGYASCAFTMLIDCSNQAAFLTNIPLLSPFLSPNTVSSINL